MKILHIGKKGNIDRFSNPHDIIKDIEIVDCENGLSDDDYLKKGKDADFIIVDAMSMVSANLINQMPHLKMIHSEGVGYNFIDVDAARDKGVYVCNCKGMNAMAVAEQTILLMLGVLRDVATGDQSVRDATQIITKENYMKNANLFELADFKIGLIGFGDIAKSTAKLLNAFGADVCYYSRHQADSEVEEMYNVQYLALNELLGYCDFISLHLPVNDETRYSVNKEFFNQMKDGSYLINTARGELVNSKDLIEALKSGKIKMAGLDCIDNEPVKKDNILIKDESIKGKILFSPHIGGITASSFKRGYAMTWSDIKKVINRERPDHIVNGL